MFGTSSHFGRGGGHGREQFHDPQNGSRHSNIRRSRGGFSQGKFYQHPNKRAAEKAAEENRHTAAADSCCRSEKKACCNLDRFLEYTTPMAPLQHLPKTISKGLRASEAECVPFFTLGDLWESFNEWSAYGAGVPILLNGSDTVIQYYVPFLSAIQIYTQTSRPTISIRRPGEESDSDYRDTSSEGSSDGEVDLKYSGSIHKRNTRGFDCAAQEGFSSDDGEGNSCLRFQYFERAVPYSREPLADKIAHLAQSFPQLKTLRSIDLLPSSWFSVAWYPIYRIPTGPTLQDLSASFLTFHSLSTPFKDGRNNHINVGEKMVPCNRINNSGGSLKIALPVFGLASYKFKGTVWNATGNCERQQGDSLLQSADEWLRLHQVQHPDYDFFLLHSKF
ncbi:hypothetical protein SUGI_0014110 [Cryptomeria japonica]|uniref:uncharacterized protein LOC131040652 n=1 Tax=Cryptomeria japonica TaxID=3369 RepID=UPI002408E498|nr:uncharacterized protein LOC131040652 [Cryptomeria japonica]GLJ05223.1 hypothetical protein SUGI_0014110 [Cryptomeria japonica]